MHRAKNFMVLIDFCNMLVKLSNSRVHTRRSKHEFYLNSVIWDICKRYITFACVQIWSSLPDNIKSAPTLPLFNSLMFNDLICNYCN